MKPCHSLNFIVLLFLVASVSAQEKNVSVSTYFPSSSQILPVQLPLPKYPEDAQKLGFGGTVSVAVTVDETGKVSSVDQVFGPSPFCSSYSHPQLDALRRTASEAAKTTRFEPALVNGQAVIIQGRINYEFILPPGSEGPQMAGLARMVDDRPDTAARVVPEPKKDPDISDNSSRSEFPTRLRLEDGSRGKLVSGGVLNGTAMELPKPPYPAAARAVRAGGSVNVQVLIGEDGKVISASAISGHPLLRSSSQIAACSAKFTPTLLLGSPVKVSGVVTYNYVP